MKRLFGCHVSRSCKKIAFPRSQSRPTSNSSQHPPETITKVVMALRSACVVQHQKSHHCGYLVSRGYQAAQGSRGSIAPTCHWVRVLEGIPSPPTYAGKHTLVSTVGRSAIAAALPSESRPVSPISAPAPREPSLVSPRVCHDSWP